MTTAFLNIDTAKSYATEANLMAALERHGLTEMSPVVVRNREGRYTAIFSGHRIAQVTPYIAAAAVHGFKTL